MAISFDGANKIISLSSGTTQLSIRDLWSRWIDWFVTSDNSKYEVAMTNVGGDEIDPIEGTYIPIYVFLQNGWKIRPQEATHTLKVYDGILLSSDGGDPFVNTLGSYIIRINYSQPVSAISFSADGGAGVTPQQFWEYDISGNNTGGAGVVNSIKTTTDKLDDTLENNAGTYRFTIASLVNAPSGSGSSPSVIAAAVRTELATELARIDVTISSRLASITYTPPPTIASILNEPLSVYNVEDSVGKTLKDTLLNAKMAFYVSA